MDAAEYDFTGLRCGNTYDRYLVFKDANGSAFNLTGSEIVFRIPKTRNGPLRKTTADGSLAMPDPVAGKVLLHLSILETRALYPGRVCRYEIERRIAGDQKSLAAGYLVVAEGYNDDV